MRQWYYAKNGQKFGPFQKSRILELYQNSEILPDDLVWEEGTAEWISALKAFGEPLKKEESASASPSTSTHNYAEFDAQTFLRNGWNILWRYPAELIGGSLLASIASVIIVAPYVTGSFLIGMAQYDFRTVMGLSGLIVYLIGLIINCCFQPFVLSGVVWMFLRAVRGEEPQLEDLLIGFGKHKYKLIACGIIVGMFSAIVFDPLSFIIPQQKPSLELVWIVLVSLAGALIYICESCILANLLRSDEPFFKTFRETISLLLSNGFKLLSVFICMVALSVIGMIFCGVGLLITTPLATLFMMSFYVHLFSDKK